MGSFLQDIRYAARGMRRTPGVSLVVIVTLYVPISFTDRELTAFGSMYNHSVVARLKPGVTVAAADAEAKAITGQLVRDLYPAEFQQTGFALSASATPIRDETVGRIQTTLYVLMAAVVVVLLIACADGANLMLTRAPRANVRWPSVPRSAPGAVA